MIMVEIGRGRPGRAGWEQDEDVLLTYTTLRHYTAFSRYINTSPCLPCPDHFYLS
jgi:hypothetical protein